MPAPKTNVALLWVFSALAAVIALAWAARQFTPPRSDPNVPARALTQPTRDDYEYTIFMKRGGWAVGLRPYVDVFSEYPPLATFGFAMPFLWITKPAGGPARASAEVQSAAPHSSLALAYADVFAAWMAMSWFGVAAMTALLAKSLNLQPARALLLLGPASLYCALQRFDPLPVAAAVGSLLAFVKNYHKTGFALLAAGVMLKIYPIVAFFVALGYVWRRGGLKVALAGVAVFAAAIAICEIPIFSIGASDPSWSAKHRPAEFAGMKFTNTPIDSGLAAVAVPFAYQGERDTNAGSLPERLFRGWFHVGDYNDLLFGIKILRILQFAAVLPAFFVGWFRPKPRVLVAATAALTVAFVLFHNIYSPQFQLWIAPLAVVAAGGRLGIAAAAGAFALDVVTYIQFPLLAPLAKFDPAQRKNVYPDSFWTIVDLRLLLTAALLTILVILALRAKTENDDGPPPRAEY